MSRGWKIILSLIVAAAVALATLPWWLGGALRPVHPDERRALPRIPPPSLARQE